MKQTTDSPRALDLVPGGPSFRLMLRVGLANPEAPVKHPPRKMRSEGCTGPITLSGYERFRWMRDQLSKDGVKIPLPTGN